MSEPDEDGNYTEEGWDNLPVAYRMRLCASGRYEVYPSDMTDAADRIEKLEAALREIAAGYETPWSTSTVSNMLNVAEILSERINIARKALEGKDG